MEELRNRRVIYWVFWALEEMVHESGLACLGLDLEPSKKGEFAIDVADDMTSLKGWRKLTHAMMCNVRLMHEVVNDPSSNWINSLLGAKPIVPLKGLVIHGPEPGPDRPELDACWSLLGLLNEIKGSRFRDSADIPRSWKLQGSLDRAWLPLMPWAGEDVKAPLLPRTPCKKRRSVAFALPLVGFGGVEKVAAQIARRLATKGFECHLAIWNESKLRADPASIEAFSTISFLNDTSAGGWDSGDAYLGTELSRWAEAPQKHERALGMLASFDAVIFAHTTSANAIAAKLRKFGVATLNHIHVTDISEFGRPVGHSHLAVAYEHSFDAILTCSQRLADWCEGFGIPQEKVVAIPNAEGFPLDRQRARRVAEGRAHRVKGALNVLFLGRFDRQKGMERVLGIAEGIAQRESDVRLRVVGERLIAEDREPTVTRVSHIEWAPGTHDPDELCRHYEWADVLLLPSHWEGLPLSVIEAQLFGAVPLVADVGAVSEAVEHGRTGFLLDHKDVVRQALGLLDALSKDRSALLNISQCAHATAMTRSWDASVAPLVEWLERKLR